MRVTPALAIVLCIYAAESPQKTFDNAVKALASGDFGAAEQGFLSVLNASPNDVAALGNLGVVYSRTQQTDKAIATYRRALAVVPDDRRLLLNLGLAFLRENAEAEALPWFRRLVRLDPDNLQAQELLATCQVYTSEVAAGAAALEKLRQRDSSNPALLYLLGVAYLKQNQRDAAKRAFDEFLVAAPPARAGLVMCKASYESGLLDEAEQHCRNALRLDPELPGAQRELGKVLVSRREPAAETALRTAVQQNGADAEALYFLGAWLLQNGRALEAIPNLERARTLNPGFWGNYFYLGRAKLEAKDISGAVSLLEKAVELNSSEPAIFYQLARAYNTAGEPDLAKKATAKVRELKARSVGSEAPLSPP